MGIKITNLYHIACRNFLESLQNCEISATKSMIEKHEGVSSDGLW